MRYYDYEEQICSVCDNVGKMEVLSPATYNRVQKEIPFYYCENSNRCMEKVFEKVDAINERRLVWHVLRKLTAGNR